MPYFSPVDPTATRPEPAPRRVLIVDDHPAWRGMIREACEQRPHLEVVGEAGDGSTALDLIRELRPDVVVLDLMMPGIPGLELAHILRAEGSPTRCLILTAREDAEALFEAARSEVAGYLNKHDTDLAELVEAIEAVASGVSIITEDQKARASQQLGDFLRRTRASSHAAARLTAREREVLALMREGLTTGQMAHRLGLSGRTVESHISSAYRKLDVGSRVQAVAKATELGLLESHT